MSKRITDESRIVHFFTHASFDKVETVHNIIAPIFKMRRATEPIPVPAATGPAKRKPRKKRQPEPEAEVAS